MPYVMVPVPAEHEEEISQFVLGLTIKAKMNTWPEGALEAFVAGLDDTERAVVARINQDALTGQYCRRPDLADAVGTDAAALDGIVQGMAERCWAEKLPTLVLIGKQAERGPDGTTVEVGTYLIAQAVSDRVRRALG